MNGTDGIDGIDRLVAQWSREKPELDTLPMALIGRLMRIGKHLETQIAACHKRYGLTLGEFDVLATLRRAGGEHCLTPSELIATMMLTSGAMTNRLDRLESKGFIVRVHSQEDRRSVSVALTGEGLTLIDELIVEHVKVQQGLMASLSDAEKPLLNGLLKTWLAEFESQE
ncbi:MarR family transcriptional regulator [uncultured Shewanella sp.]|uniref:MarR family winged helix-turn-helix transcriptional regulator n=1 Tax=uncultured Shewanella sp. TaxID=173975 RepID=UPI00262C5557|nr:MarR family transcriptional regulator [uncultured Shewanella sp.]